jgi:hypothetical protein
LVFSIHDSTEIAIQKMIEASQSMIKVTSQGEEEGVLAGGMSPPMKKTLGIRNTDSPKCSNRCRQVREAFESKEKTKGRSYAS